MKFNSSAFSFYSFLFWFDVGKMEGVSKSRGNKSFIIDVLCELNHFRGFLLFDSSTWFSGFQFCSDENSINWIDWFKCCNYCNQSNHFSIYITCGIISGCLAVNLSKLLLDWPITKCNVYTVNIISTRSNCQRSLSDEGKKYVPLPISLLLINERRTTGVRKHFPCWRTWMWTLDSRQELSDKLTKSFIKKIQEYINTLICT